jgi:cell wall-associated NlpC family hydrolase
MATQALMGTPLRLLRVERGWCQVQGPDDYIGWTDDHIAELTREEYDAWLARPKVIVTAELAYVRKVAEGRGEIVTDVVLGDLLSVTEGGGEGWIAVQLPDGRKGFLPAESGESFDRWLAEAKDTPERIVAAAKRFLGLPYFWGGTSARGLDCSGFTKTVFYMNGVLLPRDADQQARVGEPVPPGSGVPNLKVGDLLFFGRRAMDGKPERITHVGISLGGARFIHASNYVRTNSLDPADPEYSASRARSFVTARRIIGAEERTGIRRLATMPEYGASGAH